MGVEAARLVRALCSGSDLTLQTLISCGGLRVLVQFLQAGPQLDGVGPSGIDARRLVRIGVDGVLRVFSLQVNAEGISYSLVGNHSCLGCVGKGGRGMSERGVFLRCCAVFASAMERVDVEVARYKKPRRGVLGVCRAANVLLQGIVGMPEGAVSRRGQQMQPCSR